MQNYDHIVYPIMYVISFLTTFGISYLYGRYITYRLVDPNRPRAEFWRFAYLHASTLGMMAMIYHPVNSIYGL